MSHQFIIEASVAAVLAVGAIKFAANQYRELKRINRGLRLLNYVIDRANEREAMMVEALHHARGAQAA